MGGDPGMKRTPLRRVSKKRQQLLRQRSAFRKDILAANPYCVVCNDRFASGGATTGYTTIPKKQPEKDY